MARSIQLTLFVLAITTCFLTRSQAAPLDTKHTRLTRQETTPTVPTWMNDMYACWDTKDADKCNRSMMGDRSSDNSTIPAADTVEMFMSTSEEDPGQKITITGQQIQHVIEFEFNVSSLSGTIHKTEVRVYHSPANSESCDGIRLKLFTVDDRHHAIDIDSVAVHANHDGWVIFDSVEYQNNMRRMAIAVTEGSCSNVKLTELGFVVDNNNENMLPMLVVFTSQERMMTETRLLPASLVDELLVEDSVSSDGLQKRNTNNHGRCHLQSHTVHFKDINLNIIQPDKLKINLCKGSCAHPVAHNEKNNMYATIRASASKKYPSVGNPCCVPIKYNKTTLMYVSSRVYTIYYTDAIATECGCR